MDAGGPGNETREGPGSNPPTSAGLSGPPADAVFASAGVTWRSAGWGDTTTWACSHLTTREFSASTPHAERNESVLRYT